MILITNRAGVMDPAILRRAMIDIHFKRPGQHQLREVLEHLTQDIDASNEVLKELVQICMDKKPGFSYSDLFVRVTRQAILYAHRLDEPYTVQSLRKTINATTPSPTMPQ